MRMSRSDWIFWGAWTLGVGLVVLAFVAPWQCPPSNTTPIIQGGVVDQQAKVCPPVHTCPVCPPAPAPKECPAPVIKVRDQQKLNLEKLKKSLGRE